MIRRFVAAMYLVQWLLQRRPRPCAHRWDIEGVTGHFQWCSKCAARRIRPDGGR